MIHCKRIFVLCFFFLLFTSVSFSKEWYVQPSSKIRAEFDDNIRLRPDKQLDANGIPIKYKDAYGFLASLGARGGMHTELLNLTASVGVDIYQYWGQKNLDRNNVNFGFSTDYNLNEKNQLNLDFEYIKDTSLTSEVEGTGLLGGSEFGNLQIGREKINVTPSWTYFLSGTEFLKLSYSHDDVTYEKSTNRNLNSYLIDSGELSYSNQWRPAWRYFASAGASHYQLKDFHTIIDNYSLNLGLDYSYSETLSFNFMIGGRETESEILAGLSGLTNDELNSFYLLNSLQASLGQLPADLQVKLDTLTAATRSPSSTSSLGSLFAIGMRKQYELGDVSINFSRNTTPTAGGVLLQSDSVHANIEHKLTEQVKFLLSGNANFYSSTSSVNTSYNRDFYSIEPKINWLMTKEINLTGGYRYRTQEYTGTALSANNNSQATSNSFFIYLNYQWDKFSNNRF